MAYLDGDVALAFILTYNIGFFKLASILLEYE